MATTKWALDPNHAEIQFKVKHLMITTVTGSFKQFDATIETDSDDFSNARVKFTTDVNSISTHNEQRDNHLKSPDFFDAEGHPQITFEGTKFTQKSGDEYTLEGDLTIRGTTKPISLDVEFGGIMADPYGQTKAGFELNGKINRKDFGLGWGAVTEAGGVVVGDEVKIIGSVQFTKQA